MQDQRRVILGIVLLAIVIRVVAVAYFRTYDITPERDHWNFGYEAGRIARSLATGQGFSSPMPEPTGPTAFLAPTFPLILAGIFSLFGIYTVASAMAMYLLNALLSALTCVALYKLGMRMFGQRVALATALFFALYPPSIWYASGTIWDTTLLTLALVVLVNCLYGLPLVPTPSRLISIGLLMGFIVLINPAPAAFYPAVVVCIWYRLRRNSAAKRYSFAGAAILTLSCWLVFVPWMVRNAVMIGEFAPRSSSGLNFRLGNNESAWKSHDPAIEVYPSNSPEEVKRYRELGEAGYDRYCTRLAVEFIRRNPRKFVDLIWYRIFDWWSGSGGAVWTGNWKLAQTGFRLPSLKLMMSLALVTLAAIGSIVAWRSTKSISLLLALILIYPIPYYLFFVAERYRFPIEPFLLLFATHGIMELAAAALRRTGFRWAQDEFRPQRDF